MLLLRLSMGSMLLLAATRIDAEITGAAPDSGSPPAYLKYVELRKPASTTLLVGTPAFSGVRGGGISKRFSRCRSLDGKETCRDTLWIGFVGQHLREAVAPVPEARQSAERIGFTTAMQVLSLATVPVFLWYAVDFATRHEDEKGRTRTEFDAPTLAMMGMTGLAVASYVGWNVYERRIARESIQLYNTGLGLRVDAGPHGAKLDLSYRY